MLPFAATRIGALHGLGRLDVWNVGPILGSKCSSIVGSMLTLFGSLWSGERVAVNHRNVPMGTALNVSRRDS